MTEFRILAFRHSTNEISFGINIMIDVEKLKAQLDLRQTVERDLGKPRFRGRDYAAFKCPLHSEHKGYSLVVYAHHWQCFGKCHAGGDAIAWVQHYPSSPFMRRVNGWQTVICRTPKR